MSSATSRTGDSFEAVLESPLLWQGRVVAPKGARLTGKVVQAQPSDPLRESGYLRLALSGIALSGDSWPLQTWNVFVKGPTYDREAPAPPVQLVGTHTVISRSSPPHHVLVREDVGISTEHLLTFHLSQPSGEQGGQ